MQSEPKTSDSSHSQKLQTKIKCSQSMTGIEVSPTVLEDEMIQNKVDLQLYLNFQHMLKKSMYHYGEDSLFEGEKLSKIKYQSMPQKHCHQLLFLIQIFNKNDILITNNYSIDSFTNKSNSSGNFYLGFSTRKQRIDVKKLCSFNWNHLGALSFYRCEFFNNDDWRLLVDHADNFKNLKKLWLQHNEISEIKKEDISKFKSLQVISLSKLLIKTIDNNPLSKQSKAVLRRLQINKKTIEENVYYDQ